MSMTVPWPVALRGILMQPAQGIVGLVDDLLALCREHHLELDWQAGCYRARAGAGAWHELHDVSLRVSVLRAILARLAALCHDPNAGACSPYGGKGKIIIGTNPSTLFHVAFVNTPEEQRLALTRAHPVEVSPNPESALS